MLSVASVRSSSGAANYFAKDDYYTVEGSAEISVWAGEGATELGLEGEVTKDAFESILNGVLPDGEKVGQVENRRPGMDLTFSMPKSLSVMAYVAGDKRILGANMQAVKATMQWVEKNLAEGRKDVEGRKVPQRTGNLVYALFEHDTSRALDPQGHVHAVIANLTKMPDGKWQALHNSEIWKSNTVIGSIYHAFLRDNVEKLGYLTVPTGKHGTFELAGVPKKILEAFSRRREEILARAGDLGIKSAQGLRDVTTRTRDPKLNVEDRAALGQSWIDRAAELGFTGKDIFDAARARAGRIEALAPLERGYRVVADAIGSALEKLGSILRPNDPLIDTGLARSARTPDDARAHLAVASAVRMLSEREAAFPVNRIAKTALDLGLKGVTVEKVTERIGKLMKTGELIPEAVKRTDGTVVMVTTREALATEEKILAAVETGRGQAAPIVDPKDAPDRLKAVAAHELNPGQLAAATLILSSSDSIVIVQGDAGTGKSTMLQPTVRIAEAEGRPVLGLAIATKVVNDLAGDARIEANTIASFIATNERFVQDRDSPAYAAARQKHEGALLVVDETSQVPSDELLKLFEIQDALGIDKIALIGDRKQLLPVGAGKSFAMIQAAGGTMTRMSENLRQRTDTLRTVAALARIGKTGAAMKTLGDNVVEAERPAEKAADIWLALPAGERAITAVIASGRAARTIVNERIQQGLAAEGSIGGGSIRLTVFDRVNITREELRYAPTYQPGMVLEVAGRGTPDLGLAGGRYDVVQVLPNGKVELGSGRKRIRIDPQKLSPDDKRDRIALNERKTIELREGDRIRWTDRDKDRGLLKSDTARVTAIDATGMIVETSGGQTVALPLGDHMLSRLDLAYAINVHVAQGMNTEKAIGVMSSQERNLSSQRLFNVVVTRVRDALTMVVDNIEKLTRQLDSNPGDKTAAVETIGRLDIDGRQATAPTPKADPAPVGDIGMPDWPDRDDIPPFPDSAEKPGKTDVEARPDQARDQDEAPPPPPPPPEKPEAPDKSDAPDKPKPDLGPLGVPPDLIADRNAPLPNLPERQLGLDL